MCKCQAHARYIEVGHGQLLHHVESREANMPERICGRVPVTSMVYILQSTGDTSNAPAAREWKACPGKARQYMTRISCIHRETVVVSCGILATCHE